VSELPARIARLEELARDLWWSWNRDARRIFRALDYSLWRLTAHNPVRMLKLEGSARGSFLIAAALSNIGYLGWVINHQLFGKPGYDYAFMYGFYFTFAVYAIAYPIAARHSSHHTFKELPFLKRIFVEGILVYALTAMTIGILLNALGVERPSSLGKLNVLVVTAATAAMMFAAGLSVRLRAFRQHLKPSLAMATIKLIATPCIIAFVLSFFPSIDPLASKVVIVESMMPMAISCLTVSAIFHLDQDLMNAMWVTSTVLFFIIFQAALILFHLK